MIAVLTIACCSTFWSCAGFAINSLFCLLFFSPINAIPPGTCKACKYGEARMQEKSLTHASGDLISHNMQSRYSPEEPPQLESQIFSAFNLYLNIDFSATNGFTLLMLSHWDLWEGLSFCLLAFPLFSAFSFAAVSFSCFFFSLFQAFCSCSFFFLL